MLRREKLILFFCLFPLFLYTQSVDITQTLILLDNQDQQGKHQEVQKKLKQLITENKGNPKNLTQLYALQSKRMTRLENYKEAQKFLTLTEKTAQQSKDKYAQAISYYAQAFYYRYLGINDLAIEYAHKTLDTLPQDSDYYLESLIYYYLYGLHSDWDNIDQCREYIKRSLDAAQKAQEGKYDLMTNAYSAKSTLMKFLFNKTQNPKYQDSIRYYLNQSEQVCNQHPNKVNPRAYAITTINTANYFFEKWNKAPSRQLKDSILVQLNKTEKALSKVYDKDEILANAMGIRSQIALKEGNPNEAERLLIEAYNILSKRNPIQYYTIQNICNALVAFYTSQNKYDKALFYKDKQMVFQDSIYKKEQIENAYKAEAIHQNKEMKKELDETKENSKNQRLKNYFLIAFIIVLIGMLYFIYQFLQQKVKLQQEKTLRLKQEKTEAETKIKLTQEEYKRLETEKELLALKNQQIEKENLAKSLNIERKNELLEKLNTENIKKLETILKQEKRIDKSLDNSLNEFKNINPLFFEKLQSQANGKLTQLDQRYCGYIYLNLSTKEIATIFNVEAKSVRMTKYRIKQKLNLTDLSLEEFLHTLGKTYK
ncbi:hypothetical protein JSO54_05340 [Riemerella anatipestifer]|uniref:hypothetical protein n=1 Tax=Riemerella anatipestifer TaxID=34085 RepID=UPI001374DC3D|nr:hypothetical protein [Riemerella anatipestifer]